LAGDRGQAGEGLGVACPGRRGLDAVEVAVDGFGDVEAAAVCLLAWVHARERDDRHRHLR
jgi:hypothetical protein